MRTFPVRSQESRKIIHAIPLTLLPFGEELQVETRAHWTGDSMSGGYYLDYQKIGICVENSEPFMMICTFSSCDTISQLGFVWLDIVVISFETSRAA